MKLRKMDPLKLTLRITSPKEYMSSNPDIDQDMVAVVAEVEVILVADLMVGDHTEAIGAADELKEDIKISI